MRHHYDPIYFAPQPKLGGGWICHKDSPSPPPAPDYTGAAKATQTSQMSNQITPYGTQMYSASDTAPSGYTSTINLAPQAQQTLDKQMGLSNSMAGLAQGQVPNVERTYGTPLDLSSVPQIADKAYSAMTSRLDPQWQQRTGQVENQLVNQGLRPGMEGYDNAMRDFNAAKNDAYQQANLGAISTMPQTYQLASAAYNQPLNQLNALRTGAQIQNPQFSGPGTGANMLGAAQAQGQYGQNVYNQGVQSNNAMTSGLFGTLGALGSAYGSYAGSSALAAAIAASDIRLKSNIVRLGTHPLGIGIYEYDIFGKRTIGVMAQELLTVKPEAVFVHPSGYLMVDYGQL